MSQNANSLTTFRDELLTQLRDLVAAICGPESGHDGDGKGNEYNIEYRISKMYRNRVDDVIARFDQSRIDRWFDVLGDALQLTFDIRLFDGDESKIPLSHSDRARFETLRNPDFVESIESINIEAVIIKKTICEHLGRLLGTTVHGCYLYTATLAGKLTLNEIDRMCCDKVISLEHHTVIVLIESQGLLQGPLLTLVGLDGATREDISSLSPQNGEPSARKRWSAMQKHRDAMASWTAPLETFDPHILAVQQRREGLETFRTGFLILCGVLSLLQLCVSVTAEDGKPVWEARVAYPGADSLAIKCGELPITQDAFVDPTNDDKHVPDLLLLAEWAHNADWAHNDGEDTATESYDKVDILRDLLQKEIQRQGNAALAYLLAHGNSLGQEARASFTALRQKAYEDYVRARDNARQALQTFIRATNADIASLGKDVSDVSTKFAAGIIAFLAATVLSKDALPQVVYVATFVLSIAYLVIDAYFQLAPLPGRYMSEREQALHAIDGMTDLSGADYNQLKGELPDEWVPIFKRGRKPWMQLRKGPVIKRWVMKSLLAYTVWGILLTLVFGGLFFFAKPAAKTNSPGSTPTPTAASISSAPNALASYPPISRTLPPASTGGLWRGMQP